MERFRNTVLAAFTAGAALAGANAENPVNANAYSPARDTSPVAAGTLPCNIDSNGQIIYTNPDACNVLNQKFVECGTETQTDTPVTIKEPSTTGQTSTRVSDAPTVIAPKLETPLMPLTLSQASVILNRLERAVQAQSSQPKCPQP